MRTKALGSGRPAALKDSALPPRSKRKPLCMSPCAVNVAARIGPLLIISPSRQVCSTTTEKRSLAATSVLKLMSYLKISSVMLRMLLPDSPSLRAEWNSERPTRSEEHTSELQSLMRISYAVFCLKKQKNNKHIHEAYTHKHRTINT